MVHIITEINIVAFASFFVYLTLLILKIEILLLILNDKTVKYKNYMFKKKKFQSFLKQLVL